MIPAQSLTDSRTSARFARNALWTMLGFVVSLASGIVLSVFVVRTLGVERYGVWALVFALAEYIWLCDLGLRSAVLKFSAHFLAEADTDKLNEIINTGLVYFSAVAVVVCLGVAAAFGWVALFFDIPGADRDDFSFLLLVIGASWAVGLVSNVFKACLQGFQRYEVLSRIAIVGTALRVIGCSVALLTGGGIRELGTAVVLAQVFSYVLTFIALRRCFSGLRFSVRYVNAQTLLQMAHYGVYTLVATLATLLVNQGPVLLVGRLLSALYVGVYSLPVRLLANLTDAVAQIAMVMVASTADLSARGELRAVSRLGIVVNRYCLALFLPLSILLWVYGAEIFRLWVGGDAAAESARLLPLLVVGATFGIAGQHNSNAALFGLGKHRAFAYGLLIEGLLGAAAMTYVLPRQGLLGAVAISTVLLLVNRGLWAPWLVCRHTHTSFVWYMREIYLRPIIIAAPVLLGASLMRLYVLPGANWPELAAAAAAIGFVTYGLAAAVCLRPEHRSDIWRHARGFLRPARPTTPSGRTQPVAPG